MSSIPTFSGFGLGLRKQHYADFLHRDVPVDFVEIISENYMVDGGRPLATLDAILAKYPVVMHGVSMSIGSAQGLDRAYLLRLQRLVERVAPLWVSDHLCWTGVDGHNSHDLLPVPYTQEALDMVCANIGQAQDILGRPMLFENPSSYLTFPDDVMTEWEFMAAMCRRTGCYLLLDINNVFVSATNHGISAADYLAGIPVEYVRQVHLAGHTPGEILIDTHDQPVCDAVWDLYAKGCARFTQVATMIERDDDIPPLDDLLAELAQARSVAARSGRLAA